MKSIFNLFIVCRFYLLVIYCNVIQSYDDNNVNVMEWVGVLYY